MATLKSTSSDAQSTASPTSSTQTDPNNYSSPNLHVIIPVVIVLGILAFLFFGWLGLPWHMLKKQKPQPVINKLDPLIAEELELESSRSNRVGTDYYAAFGTSHTDASKVMDSASLEHYDKDDWRRSHDASPEPPTPWDPTKPDAARLK